VIIILLDLRNDIKLNFISCSRSLFGDDIYTKYSIFKYKGKTLILFKQKYFNGEEIISINEVKELATEYKEKDITISIPNNIEVGMALVGSYTNGLSFIFEKIISIEEEVLEEEEFNYYLQRGNIYIEK